MNSEVASDDDERSIIEYYFSRGYTHESIVKLLSKHLRYSYRGANTEILIAELRFA